MISCNFLREVAVLLRLHTLKTHTCKLRQSIFKLRKVRVGIRK